MTRERTPFPASLVTRLPKLKMFGLNGRSRGLIDIAGMIARGITVCYTGGGPSGSSTAELALGLMLAAARRIPQGDAAVRAGRFQLGTEPGPVLDGKVLGLSASAASGRRWRAYGRAIGNESAGLEPEPDRRGSRGGRRRRARGQGRAAPRRGRREPAPRAF